MDASTTHPDPEAGLGATDNRSAITISDARATTLRWVARVWVEVVIVGILAYAIFAGPPVVGAFAYWETIAALVAVVVMAIGHVLTWRWEIQGAFAITVGGTVIATLASYNDPDSRISWGVLALFAGPAILYWLLWQRDRPRPRARRVAVLFGVVFIGVAGATLWVHEVAYGPFTEQSDLPDLEPSPVLWAWSGGVTTDSAVINARIDEDGSRVALLIGEDASLADAARLEPAAQGEPGTATYRFEAAQLRPATTYHYSVEVDGAAATERAGRFTTFAEGQQRFSIAFGSCLRIGSNAAVLDTMRSLEADLVLLTGDLSYTDIADNDREAFRDMYATQLSTPALSTLVRSTAMDYIWDDHDYGPNDADSTSNSRPAAQTVYRESFPHYPLAAGAGEQPIYHAFTVGRTRVIVLDTRSARSPKTVPDTVDKTMLGKAQETWVAQELQQAADNDQFVVLVSSVPWIGPAEVGADSWMGYDTARRALADRIADLGLADQMVMLAGDAHMVAIDNGTHSDFSAAQSGGFPVFQAAALDRNGSVKGGPYSQGAQAGPGQFGLLTITDTGDAVEVVLSGRDFTDSEIVGYEFTVTAEQLSD